MLVRIAACGLNFADLLMANGTYQDIPPLPATLGMELAGTVAEAGPGVDEAGAWRPRRGLCRARRAGRIRRVRRRRRRASARRHAVRDRRRLLGRLRHVASGADPAGAPAARRALAGAGRRRRRRAHRGRDRRRAWAREVVAVRARRRTSSRRRRPPAPTICRQRERRPRQALKELGGVDVVYDAVGGDLSPPPLRACRPEARLLVIGFASGEVPQITANHLLVKNIDVIGFYWGGYRGFAPEVLTGSLAQLLAWYNAGRLRPHVSETFPLERAGEALDFCASRKSTGKVVVTMGREGARSYSAATRGRESPHSCPQELRQRPRDFRRQRRRPVEVDPLVGQRRQARLGPRGCIPGARWASHQRADAPDRRSPSPRSPGRNRNRSTVSQAIPAPSSAGGRPARRCSCGRRRAAAAAPGSRPSRRPDPAERHSRRASRRRRRDCPRWSGSRRTRRPRTAPSAAACGPTAAAPASAGSAREAASTGGIAG